MTTTFNELYVHEMAMLASAESQTIALLPRLVAATDTEELKKALASHQATCGVQLATVKRMLEQLNSPADSVVCFGMKALLGECSDVVHEYPKGNLRDTVMIAHMQRADHYRMAAYGSVHDYARLLGLKESAVCLDQATKAVVAATKALGQIAIQVNAEAYVDTRLEEHASL